MTFFSQFYSITIRGGESAVAKNTVSSSNSSGNKSSAGLSVSSTTRSTRRSRVVPDEQNTSSSSRRSQRDRIELIDPERPPQCVICTQLIDSTLLEIEDDEDLRKPLSCTRCPKLYHMFCLDPPLLIRPQFWQCPDHGRSRENAHNRQNLISSRAFVVTFDDHSRSKYDKIQSASRRHTVKPLVQLQRDTTDVAKVMNVLLFL